MHYWKYLLFISFFYCFSSQSSWTTSPTTIDSGNASSAASMVVDAQGNVTAAWQENNSLGNDPEAAFFSTASQQWLPPQAIQKTDAGLASPQLIVDPFGTVTLIWLEFFSQNANSRTLFASRSTQGGTWTTPVPLNSLSIPTNANIPISMVVDSVGNVTIAWIEEVISTGNYAIGTARFTSDINASPTLYPFLDGGSPDANDLIRPQLVVDQLGYVTAVWQEQTGSGNAVQAARLDPYGSSWSTPINLNASDAYVMMTPQMVVDTSGVVTVVWLEGIPQSLQAARFTPGVGGAGGSWTTYTSLAPAFSDVYSSITPQIVVDADGSVTVVAVTSGLSVWPSSFTPGESSWTYPASPLNSGTAYVLTPLSLVVDTSGIVTVLWMDSSPGQLYVQASRGFSNSWSTSVNLNSGSASGNTPLLLVIDTSDNVTASWTEGLEMQAARFISIGTSWGTTATLSNADLYLDIPPKMVVSPSGCVTIVWQSDPDSTSTYSIQAARFTPGESSWTLPITLNNGSQVPNAFGSPMTQLIYMVADAFDNVTVTWLENSIATAIVQAARFVPPMINSITPNQGSTSGGTIVTINGTDFIDVSHVYFGSLSASFTVINDSKISAISPPGNAGVVDVTVATHMGITPITENNQFTYISSQPVVTGINPNQGPTTGGTVVTITGADFNDVTHVLFGSKSALFNVNNSSQITAISPTGDLGTVNVTVITSTGTSTISDNDRFTYFEEQPIIISITPNQGPTLGGTVVRIIGTGFSNVSDVLFGSKSASFSVDNDTQITAVSPIGDVGSVHVTVITHTGSSTISHNDRFTYFQGQPFSPAPPTHLRGFQIKKKNGKHVVNVLTWNRPSLQQIPSIISYRIYEGLEAKKLLGTVANNSPLRFVQKHRQKAKSSIYSVVSVDSTGRESLPAYVIVSPLKLKR